MKKIAILFVLFLNLNLLIFTENIHGPVSDIINIKEDQVRLLTTKLKLEELLIIDLNSFKRLKAIEIEIDFPKELLKYNESFGLFFYDSLEPEPSKENNNYKANKIYTEIIPQGKKHFFKIPLSSTKEELTSSLNTKIFSNAIPEKNYPILLTILPLMKGIPDTVYNHPITINIKELLYDIGELKINLEYPDTDKSKTTFFIDNIKYDKLGDVIELTTGLHTLIIQSETYQEQNISFGINKDEKTVLNIKLEKSTPKLLINAPSNTITFLDGKKVDFTSTDAMDITEGKHTLLFKLADFKASKEFTALSGKTYSISLFLDILIQEN